jgi:hypothetical protein
MMSYYKLESREYDGRIAKKNGINNEIYNPDTKTWEFFPELNDFLLPYDDKFELFEEISEREALKYVS